MIIGVCGMSGSGKDTIVNAIKEIYQSLELKSYVTRAMRPGEVNGEKYHFCSHLTFACMKDKEEFGEIAEYSGNFYGITNEEIRQAAESNEIYTVIAIPSGLDDIEKALGNEPLFRVYIDAEASVRDGRFISRLGRDVVEEDYQILAERKQKDEVVFGGAKENCDLVIDNTKDIQKDIEFQNLARMIVIGAKEFYEKLEANLEVSCR